jgi:adenylate cyclase, class 2
MKGRKPADRENEIKLALPDAATGRRLLRKADFRMLHPRVFEVNVVFDTPDRHIIGSGKLLRLRAVKGKGVLAYKGPADGGRPHKSREEIEAVIENPAAMRLVLERLGYQAVFRYEKFRTEFARTGEPGLAMLDETPIGVYLELEGPARWIDRTARMLGFTKQDYITRSYARLYFESRAAEGTHPGDMVFGQ